MARRADLARGRVSTPRSTEALPASQQLVCASVIDFTECTAFLYRDLYSTFLGQIIH